MSESDSAHWTEALHHMLESASVNDGEVIDFIDRTVPDGEGKLYDNKRQVYVHFDNSDTGKERKFKLLKHISALANTRAEPRFRYLFICFGDDGQFIGASDYQAKGGEHIAELDESKVQDVFSNSLEPEPDVERHIVEQDGKKGVVIMVRRADSPPILFDEAIQVDGGNTTLCTQGVGYVRKGSQSLRMGNSDYRIIIERRENLVNQKLEETIQDLNRMVGIPSDQLEDLDLAVSSGNEGVPINEIVTTEGYSDIDKRISLSVKEWNSSGELYSNRDTIYKILKRRDEFEVDDERCEFLIWSSLNNNVPPTEWIIRHSGNPESAFEEFYREKLNGRTISVFESSLYVLGESRILDMISSNTDMDYKTSKAEKYSNGISKPIPKRVEEVTTRKNIPIAGHEYNIQDLVQSGGPMETGLEETTEELLKEDTSNGRNILRAIEYTRLGRNLYGGD